MSPILTTRKRGGGYEYYDERNGPNIFQNDNTVIRFGQDSHVAVAMSVLSGEYFEKDNTDNDEHFWS